MSTANRVLNEPESHATEPSKRRIELEYKEYGEIYKGGRPVNAIFRLNEVKQP